MRAIAGLWPWGGGSVNFHPDRRLFMLPQRPYVPSGTLRRAVAYPGAADDWTVEEIGEALHKVGLDHLKEKIEEDAPWDQTLSGGEKQRLAFARLLLHNPDIVVLDEATSALDEKSQDKMMDMVMKELPKATIVSVAHRAELEAFHSRKIALERRKGGAKLVSDIDLIPRKGKRRLLGRFLRHRKAPCRARPRKRPALIRPLEPRAKPAMHAPLRPRLRPEDFRCDSRQRSIARAIRRVCAECGAGCDHSRWRIARG